MRSCFGTESRIHLVLRMLSAKLAVIWAALAGNSRVVCVQQGWGNALGGDDLLATMSDLTRDRRTRAITQPSPAGC